MAEHVWVPVSSKLLSGKDVLVERRLMSPFGHESLENHLEEMAAKGWLLQSVSPWGFAYTFVRGEPRKIRYFVDYCWVDFKSFWRQSMTLASTRRVKFLPYDGERPEDRNALLSQMVMYRYIQLLYGSLLVTYSSVAGADAVSSLLTPGLGSMQVVHIDLGAVSGFFLYLDILLNTTLAVVSEAFNVFILLFLVALFVIIIIIQVKHSKARRRLAKAA